MAHQLPTQIPDKIDYSINKLQRAKGVIRHIFKKLQKTLKCANATKLTQTHIRVLVSLSETHSPAHSHGCVDVTHIIYTCKLTRLKPIFTLIQPHRFCFLSYSTLSRVRLNIVMRQRWFSKGYGMPDVVKQRWKWDSSRGNVLTASLIKQNSFAQCQCHRLSNLLPVKAIQRAYLVASLRQCDATSSPQVTVREMMPMMMKKSVVTHSGGSRGGIQVRSRPWMVWHCRTRPTVRAPAETEWNIMKYMHTEKLCRDQTMTRFKLIKAKTAFEVK